MTFPHGWPEYCRPGHCMPLPCGPLQWRSDPGVAPWCLLMRKLSCVKNKILAASTRSGFDTVSDAELCHPLSAVLRQTCERGNIALAQTWPLTCQLWLSYFLIGIWCDIEESWWSLFPSRSDMSFARSALSSSLSLCLSMDHALRESKGSTTSAKRYLQSFHLPNVFHTPSCLHEAINKPKDQDADFLRIWLLLA